MHKGEGANKLHIYKWHVQYPVGYATWLALPGPRDSNQLCGQVYQRQLTRKSGTFCDPILNGRWVMVWTSSKWVNSDFKVKFDLEGQGQLSPKTIGTLTKVFCIFGLNLVILAWTGLELSRGQASDWHTDWHTHGHTDTGNDNTRRSKLALCKNGIKHRMILGGSVNTLW